MFPDPMLLAAVAGGLAVFLARGNSGGSRQRAVLDRGRHLVVGLARRRRGTPMPSALILDLVAAALETGVPPDLAVRAVVEALAEIDDPRAEALARDWERSPVLEQMRDSGSETAADPLGALRHALDLARSAGIAPASLVRSAAERERRRRAAAQAVAARRLGVFAVLPVALCLLPAFLVLAVVPVVLDLLRDW